MTDLRKVKPGDTVALVNHHWNRNILGKRTVARVHKTGRFTLLDHEGKPGATQWRPNHDGTIAHHAGASFRGADHLEPWSPEIEAELRAAGLARKLDKRRDAIVETLRKMRREDLKVGAIEAMEAFLGLKAEDTKR